MPRVTPLEYWLLDLVVEYPHAIFWLTAPNLDEVINRRGHGAERGELVDCMANLFERGLLAAERDGIHSGKQLSANEIEAALDEDPDGGLSAWTYYELTDKGARLWESLSFPRWERYLQYWRSHSATWLWVDEVTGMDADLVERCYGHMSRQFLDGAIDPATVVRSEVGAWKACYWKWLPSGFRIVYFGRDEDLDPLWGTEDKPFAVDPEFVTGEPDWYTRRFEGESAVT